MPIHIIIILSLMAIVCAIILTGMIALLFGWID